jgi:hypothetical protein
MDGGTSILALSGSSLAEGDLPPRTNWRTMENKPVHVIRLGMIRATIWANHRLGEDAWYRVTTSRLYRSGEKWHGTQSFRRDDLPILSRALEMAHSWLWNQGPDAYDDSRNGSNIGVAEGDAVKRQGEDRHGVQEQGRRRRQGPSGSSSVHQSGSGKKRDATRTGRRTSSTSSRKKGERR